MNIQRAANISLWLKAVLCILVLLSCHVFLVSALTSIGNQQAITTEDNTWLLMAKAVSVANPDVAASLALYQRNQALLVEETQKKSELLNSALAHWYTAIEQRPLWPYHHLGALDIEVLLNKPADVIQQRIQTMISQTPNERGMDKSLLELAIFSWSKLSEAQRQWMVKRLQIMRPREIRFVLSAAKKVNRKSLMCANLPLNKSKHYCH